MKRIDERLAFGLWTGLMRASTRLGDRIEADLKAAGLPPLGWYDALWEIQKAGDDGLRPVELQPRLLLPQYGLSRLIDRLVRAGYVARGACADDGRGQILRLTPEGRTVREKMWPVYRQALLSALDARLSPAGAENLSAGLAALAQPPVQGGS
jgi:DNA-binding MarR family transcriptional regulator